ncbi:uncharacterized protein LOC112576311 isoform X2 [Pomacea canaliculata]|uniref:uncharacterized protein LOC112576311 isoform X1 n=1 Tax=Pomacea canaliculata TaxID=400727 RepID=UPI000D73ED69|nr:uncharacterized protein LOC112576311 isoform X1 [Pomacea canaliculata]XP_025114452.1 uncharacterized protein LOC112576311 isoform X2 [Pomacea canaliculata]
MEFIISLLPFMLCASLPVQAVSSVPEFNVTLTYDGSFGIRVRNKPWFTSTTPFLVADGVRYGVQAPVVIPGMLPIMDAPLVLTDAEWADGKDALGSYTGVSYTYYANITRLLLTIRAYDSIVVFTQAFPDGLNNTGVPDKRKVLSGYPGFQWDFVFQGYIPSGYLTYSGPLDGIRSVRKGRWEPWQQTVADGREASGPLCLFNASGSEAVIISPLTKVMTLSPWHRHWPSTGTGTDGQSYWGIDRDIETLPPGYKAEVILVYSPYGVGQVFEDWGDAMRRYSGQGAPASHWSSGLDKVGYWTGPGSFYYDNTGQNTTYEDVILEVEKKAKIQRVPFGFLELDNWWYESEANRTEAIVTWAANNNSLPDGLGNFEQPLVVVCSAW